jgi:hypothetical protein
MYCFILLVEGRSVTAAMRKQLWLTYTFQNTGRVRRPHTIPVMSGVSRGMLRKFEKWVKS